MIHGIGIDLIEIERIKVLYNKQSKLVDRILTENEQRKFYGFTNEQRKIEFLAGRFATKEAFSKALGTGLGKHVAFNDIDCYNDDLGKPNIDYDGFIVHVSISHTEHYAVSQVILEKEES
ncbi:holo-ACP synthase [Staphylococcus argenteus]|uniref:holo-ACP synthase n=1 Tax=Staphylococcus argenteus TaxID=985002 RepID=UPI0005068DB2|nr:holo-ACP synthase [Staphylococcus argenteus]API79999.1 holo-ACP synthase [Staphylococcus argenteus]MBE2124498.1 holo-ACP synthase [Staphylococcus argenteus]MBE2142632.1 holo-ACP synthase [Staphylococcus argenteus]MCG6477750.1 holo-ACP synthase [Staphylococcus argenteus]MCG9807373.1 holo-ACP synthase [Staphylococcus argenteus]